MEDDHIVQLYWDRNQRAINETAMKYGKYCTTIAKNILGSFEDAEECVNDTYMNAWNSIPPERPNVLSAFLGRITRNLAFNKYKHEHTDKRGGGEILLVLDELAECVSGRDSVEEEVTSKELAKEIENYLASLSEMKRRIFVCRYWYADSVKKIAKQFGMKENAVSMTLSRVRKGLQTYLEERGFEL